MRCNKTLEVLATILLACASGAASAPTTDHSSLWDILLPSTINPQSPAGEISKGDHDLSLQVDHLQLLTKRREELEAWNSTTDWMTCPPPLIPNVQQLATNWCRGPCCLPCPASLLFYEPKRLERIYTVKCVFDIISCVSCALLAICYCILPGRRKHPQSILLWFAIIIIPRSGVATIWLYRRADLHCRSVYETATMSNNWMCGLQGVLVVYSFQVGLCISFLLIANLHFLAAYRSVLIQVHLTKLFVISFLLPLCVAIPVAVKRGIEYSGIGTICQLSPELSAHYFHYPVLVIVCIATLLHLGTIAFAIKVKLYAMRNSHPEGGSNFSSRRGSHSTASTHRQRLHAAHEISLVLQQQWRVGLFAVCLVAFFLNYWLFLLTEPKKIQNLEPNLPWFIDWVHCLCQQASSGNQTTAPLITDRQAAGDIAQSACASIAAPYVPSVPWLTVTEFSRAFEGLIFSLTFASKADFRHDLREKLFGNRVATGQDIESRRGSRDDHHKHPQFQQYHGHPQDQESPDNELHTEKHSAEDLNSIGEVPAPLPEVAPWHEGQHARSESDLNITSGRDLERVPSLSTDTVAAIVAAARRSAEGSFSRVHSQNGRRRCKSHDGTLQAASVPDGLDSQPLARSQSALTQTPKIAWGIIPPGSARKNSSSSTYIASTLGMNSVEALHPDGDMLITHKHTSDPPHLLLRSSIRSRPEKLPGECSSKVFNHSDISLHLPSVQPPPSQPLPPVPRRSDRRPSRDSEHK